MLCPKCKKTDLQTKRTLANGPTVRRERFCPKCKLSHWTVELFETNLEHERVKAASDKMDTERKLRYKEMELDRFKEGLKAFKTLIDSTNTHPKNCKGCPDCIQTLNNSNSISIDEEDHHKDESCPDCGESLHVCEC